MKIHKILLVSTAIILSFQTYAESDKQFALGLNLGTKGIGADVGMVVNDNISLRGTFSQYEASESFEEDGIVYDGDFDLDNFGIVLDYYPFKGNFRLSAGYYSNSNQIDALAQPETGGTVDINGYDYNISGEWVRTNMDWDSSAPYMGIGWGNAFSEGSNWTFTLDLGVLFTGEPTAALTASPGLHQRATDLGRTLSDDLDAEQIQLNDDLSDFDLYPVIQLGVTYSF